MNVSMYKTKSIGLLILSLTIVLSGAVLLASAVTPPPNKFSGDVILNGTDASIGTTIEAFIDGDSRGNITVGSAGKYEYLFVNGDSSDDGMPVTFTVDGLPASTDRSATWTAWIEAVQIINLVAGDAPAGDITSPGIAITAPTSGASFTTATITVSGTASDNEGVSKVQVKVGSGDWMDATGTTSWSKIVTTSHGIHTIEVRAIDTTGNPSETVSIIVACNPPSSGIVVTQGATPAGTDAQSESGETVESGTSEPTTGTSAPAATSTKPATKPETKGLPGFEAMSVIAGLLAVAYLIRNRV